MTLKMLFRITLLASAMLLFLTGCSDGEEEMSQQEIQYLSHLDQARFFQRQGELKASTLEARSAIELAPGEVDPYFIIVDNLVEAGDAVTAARQVKEIDKRLDDGNTPDSVHNRIQLVLSRTHLMRRQSDAALEALKGIHNPDRTQAVQADLLRGDIFLTEKQLDASQQAYQSALDADGSSVPALIGLSKVAHARDDGAQADQRIAEAAGIDPNYPELWLWKAQLAKARERWSASEEAYIRALEDIGQYDIMTYRKYTTISSLIEVLREQGKSSEAFVYEEILAKSAPGTVKSNFAAAQEAYQQGNLPEAARYLNEILKQVPHHVQSSVMLGMIRFQQGRVEEAEELLAPIAQAQDSAAASKLLAAAQLRLQRPEQARELLENLSDEQADPGVLALMGIASLAAGDTVAGREYIEKSLELNPENTDLRLRYARYLIDQGKTADAIEQASAVMDMAPDNDQARALIVDAYATSGDIPAAEESAAAWVKEQPDNVSARIISGGLAAAGGDNDQARQYYQQALELSDTDPRANNALGALAATEGNPEEAARQFKAAITRAPDNRQSIQGLAQVSSPDALRQYLDSVVQEHPDAVAPRLALLELALRAQDITRADELAARLLEPVSETELSPHTQAVADLYGGVAGTKLQEDDTQAALAIMRRAQALFPDNEKVTLQTARAYFDAGNPDKARELIRDARLAHPESATPYLVEATYEKDQENYGKAADLYELALAKDDSPRVTLLYVGALQQHGQNQRAIDTLEKATGRYPDNPSLELRLAMAYQSVGESKKAIDAYQSILQGSPRNVVALNNLAWLYHESGEQDARALAEKAYSLEPESAAVADTYGWILFQQGNHTESLPVLEKAYALSPDTPEIAQHLAEVYRTTGRTEDAEKILSRL